ncbi:MAG: hypothetical protein ACTICP_12410, partial [Microbacterium sp.]
MAFGRSTQSATSLLRLTRGGELTTLEKIVLLVVIVGLIAVDVLGVVFAYGPGPLALTFSVATTAVFALYLWLPWVATAALVFVLTLSFVTGADSEVILAAAVATGLVTRLGRTWLILSYAGVFLVGTAIVGLDAAGPPVNIGIYLIIAAVSGAIGFLLRAALDRGRRLEEQLALRAQQEREAVL